MIIHQNVFLKNKNISKGSRKERKCKPALRIPQWEAACTVAIVPGPEILEMKSKKSPETKASTQWKMNTFFPIYTSFSLPKF